jgi:hypothetical protein
MQFSADLPLHQCCCQAADQCAPADVAAADHSPALLHILKHCCCFCCCCCLQAANQVERALMSLLLEGAWELGGEAEDVSQQELEAMDPLLLVSAQYLFLIRITAVSA